MTTNDPLRNRGSEGVGLDPGAVRKQLESTDLNRHIASFYHSRAEQLAVATAFVGLGLEQNELCLYFTDDNDPSVVRDSLEQTGIDVSARERAGQLRIERAADTYLDGGFDPDATLREFERAVSDSTEAGYNGVRVLGENTWNFAIEGAFDQVLDFEVAFDEQCRDVPVAALCQYSLDRFDDESIGKAIQTHEQIVYRGTLCENPYYVPPAEYFERGRPRKNSWLMLEQLQELTRSRQEVAAREQRLSVINRVLRHNIRNEMSVLLGHLELLTEGDHVDDEGSESVETVTGVAEEFLELAEKAQYVERTLGEFEPRRLDMSDLLERVAARVGSDRVDVTVQVDAPVDATATADPDVEIAVEELLSAVTTEVQAGTTITASLGSDTLKQTVQLDVTGSESLLPDGARRAVDSNRETKLEHCNGLSVWIARWIVERSHGSLEYAERGSGDRIRVSLPAPNDS